MKLCWGYILLALCIAWPVQGQIMPLSYYRGLVERFPRHYEEVALNSLSEERLQPLWASMLSDNRKSLLMSIFGKRPTVELSRLADRLVDLAGGRLNMPQLRRYAYKRLAVESQDTIISIGALGGSLYSFVQILLDLLLRGVIDEELKICDTHTFLVINGDYSSPSPFWFFVLDLIASLLEQNPLQCIVLRGRAERFSYWQGVDTTRVFLKQFSLRSAGEEIPYAEELNAFFNSLPDVLLVQQPNKKEEIIISHHVLPQADLAHPYICSWISSEGAVFAGRCAQGFGFSRFRCGVAQWGLFSAPDFVNSNEMSGYLAIPIQDKIEQLIGVYRYAPRDAFGVPFAERRYALSYGFELRTPADEARLQSAQPEFVCSTADLSGGTALVGENLSLGVETVLLDANQRGVCSPILFRHVVFDDRYTPASAQKNVAQFINDYGATYLLAPQGSPTLTSYIDLVKDKKLAVLFTESGATQFRSPGLPYIVNLRPSFAREVEQLLAYLFSRNQIKKLASVYQDDAFGNPLLSATRAYLAQQQAATVELVALPYVRGQASFADMNELIKDANAEAIAYFITSSGPAQGFFGGDMAIFLKGRHVLLVLVDESIIRVLDRFGIACMYSSSVPNPIVSNLPMVRLYRELFSENHFSLSSHSLLGFISGQLFVHGVQELLKEKKPVDGAGCVALFEGYKAVDILGFNFSFDPTIRSFSLPVWIHLEDGRWISPNVSEATA